jgi:hypothetical protein
MVSVIQGVTVRLGGGGATEAMGQRVGPEGVGCSMKGKAKERLGGGSTSEAS